MSKNKVGLTIRLNPLDNVVVARVDVKAGTRIPEEGVTALSDVPYGLKIASRDIKKGEEIRKYNTVIGFAAEDTPAGQMMHSHNIKFENFERDYAFGKEYQPWEIFPPEKRAVFQGYKFPDGRVATRNYIGVLVLGNCGATVARKIPFLPLALKSPATPLCILA